MPASNENVYISVGPHCWGRSDTRQKAIREMKRNWPSMVPPTAEYAVYSCHPDTRVTEFGELAYPHGADPVLVSRGRLNRSSTFLEK